MDEYLQEAAIKKKYGGIMPRKTPLISKVFTKCMHTPFKEVNLISLYGSVLLPVLNFISGS
jgi:hypothetical protein